MSKQLKGDINNDGKITSMDAAICLQIIAAEPIDFTEQEKARADVNNDGKITIYDLLLIQKYILGKVSFK